MVHMAVYTFVHGIHSERRWVRLMKFLFAIKDTQNDAFWADYCSEGHLTRRLNAVGCPNVVKVHGWLNLGLRPLLRRPDEDESPPVEKEYFFRILYDYYPGGSLDALFHVYFQNRYVTPCCIWHDKNTIEDLRTNLHLVFCFLRHLYGIHFIAW